MQIYRLIPNTQANFALNCSHWQLPFQAFRCQYRNTLGNPTCSLLLVFHHPSLLPQISNACCRPCSQMWKPKDQQHYGVRWGRFGKAQAVCCIVSTLLGDGSQFLRELGSRYWPSDKCAFKELLHKRWQRKIKSPWRKRQCSPGSLLDRFSKGLKALSGMPSAGTRLAFEGERLTLLGDSGISSPE